MDNILISLFWFMFGYFVVQLLFIVIIFIIDMYENRRRQKIYHKRKLHYKMKDVS